MPTRGIVLSSQLSVDRPPVSYPLIVKGDLDAQRVYAFFAVHWTVGLLPRRPECDLRWAAQHIGRVTAIHDHARIASQDVFPLPEANLHDVLMADIQHARREATTAELKDGLDKFMRREDELRMETAFRRIAPRVTDAFQRANGFDPPAQFGEMCRGLAAYSCALRVHPEFQNPDAIRSLLAVLGAGNILFRLDGSTIHNLCLAG